MNRLVKSALISTVAAASLMSVAHAQSSPGDPLGINASEDTSIERQRGGLQGGVNSGLGGLPDSYRNQDAVGGWSFEDGSIVLRK